MDAWEVVTAVASAAAACVAAWGAWQAKKAADKAHNAAADSNRVAETVANIEQSRRHAELTPIMVVSCGYPQGIRPLSLTITFADPPGLDRVDTLTVRIRDDIQSRARNLLAGGPTKEEIEKHIWGPVRFTPGSGPDGALADDTGRETRYEHPLAAGDSLTYVLETTNSPPWSKDNAATWLDTISLVLKLTITATSVGQAPWTLPCQLELSGVLGASGDQGSVSTVVPARPESFA